MLVKSAKICYDLKTPIVSSKKGAYSTSTIKKFEYKQQSLSKVRNSLSSKKNVVGKVNDKWSSSYNKLEDIKMQNSIDSSVSKKLIENNKNCTEIVEHDQNINKIRLLSSNYYAKVGLKIFSKEISSYQVKLKDKQGNIIDTSCLTKEEHILISKFCFSLLSQTSSKFHTSLITEGVTKSGDKIISFLGTITHENYIKQKTVCLIGTFNSGKSLLVANILKETIGYHNLGLISSLNDGFAFEQIENKELIICDEFNYNKKQRSNLLNLLDNREILLNKKFKEQILYTYYAPVIFIFNDKQNNDLINDKAFLNILIVYSFTKLLVIDKQFYEIQSLLKNELASIIIYCNNLYFKNNNKNRNIKQAKQELLDIKNKEYNVYNQTTILNNTHVSFPFLK